jgi:hypothetical protein
MGEWKYSSTILDLCARWRQVPGTRWIGGWVGLEAGLDAIEKRKILLLSGIESDSTDP